MRVLMRLFRVDRAAKRLAGGLGAVARLKRTMHENVPAISTRNSKLAERAVEARLALDDLLAEVASLWGVDRKDIKVEWGLVGGEMPIQLVVHYPGGNSNKYVMAVSTALDAMDAILKMHTIVYLHRTGLSGGDGDV